MTLPKNVAPFFVGFDRLFNQLDTFTKAMPTGFPPYNIRKVDDNKYMVELAVAGFSKSDIEIELDGDVLRITGRINDDNDSYLYKGISNRAFTRTFNVAETVEVKDATLVNGMLKVFLENIIPESKKAKKIEVKEAE